MGDSADMFDLLAKYRFIRPIDGRSLLDHQPGTARAVWLVEDRIAGTPHAVKLRGGGDQWPLEAVFAFLKSSSSQLLARSVVPILSHGRSTIGQFLVSPYYPAGSLASVLPLNSLKEREDLGRRLVADMVDALTFLHSPVPASGRNEVVVHGDIKPGNILIDTSGREQSYLLCDFDAAERFDYLRAGRNAGRATPRYGPPERFGGGATRAGDLWSLGLVLYEILEGRYPLNDCRDTADLGDYWLPTFSEGVKPEWQALCFGLLRLHPRDRWTLDKLYDWLNPDEGVRAKVIANGLQLGLKHVATEPFWFGDISVQTAEAAAEIILSGKGLPAVMDPSALAGWVGAALGMPARAAQIRESIAVVDVDLRVVHISLRLDSQCPLMWRGRPLTEQTLSRYARDEDRGDWIDTLRTSSVFEAYSAREREDAVALASAVQGSFDRLEDAWTRMTSAGCPTIIPPDRDLWRLACRLPFDPAMRAEARVKAREVLSPLRLLSTEPWFAEFGADPESYNIEQCWVIQSIPSELQPSFLEHAEEIDASDAPDEELDRRPTIFLKSHASLIRGVVGVPGTRVVGANQGECVPANGRPAMVAARLWVREGLYPAIARMFRMDPVERLARRAQRRVGDAMNAAPDLVLRAAVYDFTFPVEIDAGPQGKLARIYWTAPAGWRIRLSLGNPGVFHDSKRWRGVELARRGRIVIALWQSTSITLVARPDAPGWFMPRFRSRSIILFVPPPNLELIEQVPLFKPNDRIAKADIQMLKDAGEITYLAGKIGQLGSYSREQLARRQTIVAVAGAIRSTGRPAAEKRTLFATIERTAGKHHDTDWRNSR